MANQKHQKVFLNLGEGTTTREFEWQEGDTVADIMRRAEVTIPAGKTAVISNGKTDDIKVDDPAKTVVSPGDIIVIAGAPGNGHN